MLLVRKGIIKEVYKIATISTLQKNNLFAVSLFHFFNSIYINKQIELLLDVVANVRGTEIASLVPFNKMIDFTESLSKADSIQTSTATPILDQEKERMDEEAYFDSEDEGDVVIPSVQQRELPSFGPKEEEKEEEKPSGDSSILSFFGSGLKTSSPLKLSLSVSLGPPEDESESKRVKLE